MAAIFILYHNEKHLSIEKQNLINKKISSFKTYSGRFKKGEC